MFLGKLSRSAIIGENESSKYWLSVLNSLKNRGVQDILILCSDGLTGIKDAISTAFPKTEQQRCMGCGLSQIMVKYLQRLIFSITPSTIRDFARSPQREKSPVRASKTRQAAKGKVIGKFEKINSHNQYQRGNGQKKYSRRVFIRFILELAMMRFFLTNARRCAVFILTISCARQAHDRHSLFVNHASMLTRLRSLYHDSHLRCLPLLRNYHDPIRRSSIMQAC